MFENLFKRPHAVRRHTTYPLLEERLLYLRHLSDRHFSRNSLRMVAQYLLVITDHLDLPGHAGEVVTHAAIEAAAAHWAANGMQRHRRRTGDPHRRRVLFARHATRWLRFLGRLEKPVGDPGPCDDLIASFRDHMKRERGLSERTVDLWGRLAGDFLKRLGATRASLSEMTIADIGDGLTEIAAERKYARRTIRQHASALRAFFRYAEDNGWCSECLADGIWSPRIYRHDQLPTGPSWHEVRRLLRSVEDDRLVPPGGNRDTA